MGNTLDYASLNGLLLRHVPAAVALFDTEMRYLACSHRWLADYRIVDPDIIGKSHYEVFPEIGEHWRTIHRRALAGESLAHKAEVFERADGTVDWVQWEIVPWYEEGGKIGGVALFTQVVTEDVLRRQRGLAMASELELLIDSATEHAICMLGADGRIAIWNVGAERLFGWAEAEALGMHYEALFEPGDVATGLPALQIETARTDGKSKGSHWRVRKDGSRFHADVVLTRIDGMHGASIAFCEVVRDRTQDDEVLRAAEAHHAYLNSILDTVPDAIITIDEWGSILSFSAAAEQVFGYDASEVIGCNVKMLMPGSEAEKHDGYLARYRSTGEPHILGALQRVFGQRKDGSVFPHALYVGEANGGGRRIFTGFLRDLTDQEDAEGRVRELQSELIHISRISAVGTMATALAHELNQPLMAIANYVQSSAVLLESAPPEVFEAVREALDEAGREALRAGAIVQRLREFVASGELDRVIVNPRELAQEGCDLGGAGGRARGIDCRVVVPATLPPVLVDRVQIQQVLLNLIRNAFEAIGENGLVVIDASRDGAFLCFSVVDNGPGIEAGREEQLFEPFISSKASGMGIGLAICRTIVEAHGGRMWCERLPTGGAGFFFTLPVVEISDA